MAYRLEQFLVGFHIPKSITGKQLHNAALDMWGTDFTQVARSVAAMETYQDFDHFVWIRALTRQQAATAIYWAESIGAGVCVIDPFDNSGIPLMFFIRELQHMPALTAVHKNPIDLDYLYCTDLIFNGQPKELPSSLVPRPETIILPPPLDSMMRSRSNPNPDVVVPFFEIGITLDRDPSDEVIGKAVAELFPLHPSAWQFHVKDFIANRDHHRRGTTTPDFLWISANSRQEAGLAIFWGVSLGAFVAVLDAQDATPLPLESFYLDVTLMNHRASTAIADTPITEEFLRTSDIGSQSPRAAVE